MTDADPDRDEVDGSGSGVPRNTESSDDGVSPPSRETEADTFGVGVHLTTDELQFVVHVPSSIGSGWTDPEAFQRLVERVVWDHLDKERTLRAIASAGETGETVTLGTVTLRPDGTVVDRSLQTPTADGSDTEPVA